MAQEKPSECPAASAAILCLILALDGTKQRWRTVLSDSRGNTCEQCGLIIPVTFETFVFQLDSQVKMNLLLPRGL